MQKWRQDLVAEWRSQLRDVRRAAPDFEAIKFAPTSDEGGLTEDANRRTRAKCLWALQYEPRRPSDPLPAELLRAEIAWHRKAPFQGYSDELKLAAYLVALEPADAGLELMWPAKTANFDTWCGFDSRLLGVGGVDDAINRAANADPPQADLIDNLMVDGQPRFSDEDVAALVSELAEYFPGDPDDEAAYTWFERARILGDLAVARQAVTEWVRSDTPPADNALQFAWASIGCFDEAVAVQSRVVAAGGGARKDPLAAIRLAELQRQAGDLELAYAALKGARRGVNRATDPNGYVRRRLAEEGFLIAKGAGGRLTSRAFRFADAIARDKTITQVVQINGREPSDEWLPLVVLEAGAAAAAAAGKRKREVTYRDRALRERERISTSLPPKAEG